jgi:hypothetical protein
MRIIPGKNQPGCLDCLGKQMQTQKDEKARKKDDDYDDYYYDSSWSYGYRYHYYRNNNYSPWYDGDDLNDSYYSELDVRSFDDKEIDEVGADDSLDYQAEANVFDS